MLVITADTEAGVSGVKLQIGHYLLEQEVKTDEADAAMTGTAEPDEPDEPDNPDESEPNGE